MAHTQRASDGEGTREARIHTNTFCLFHTNELICANIYCWPKASSLTGVLWAFIAGFDLKPLSPLRPQRLSPSAISVGSYQCLSHSLCTWQALRLSSRFPLLSLPILHSYLGHWALSIDRNVFLFTHVFWHAWIKTSFMHVITNSMILTNVDVIQIKKNIY